MSMYIYILIGGEFTRIIIYTRIWYIYICIYIKAIVNGIEYNKKIIE